MGRRPECKKDQLYNEILCEWDLQNSHEMVLGLGEINEHVGIQIHDFEGVHGAYGFVKKMLREEDCLKHEN